jgi:hypothetical protein
VNNSVLPPFLDEDGHAFKLCVLNSSAKFTHRKNQRFKCKTKFRKNDKNVQSAAKIVIPLKLLSQYPFLPTSLLAQIAYMLRKSSQLLRLLMMFMHLPTF